MTGSREQVAESRGAEERRGSGAWERGSSGAGEWGVILSGVERIIV